MRLQILHLSDLHIKNTADSYEINIKKITQVFNSCDIKSTDEFVIVVSGDLAQSGKSTEYKVVSSFIGAMFKEINVYTVAKKRIDYVCVPGNHDLDFDKLNIGKFEMEGKRNLDELQGILEAYSESMKSFFSHANRQNCFRDNKWVSKKVCCVGTHKIGFVMVNSTAMSVLGGTAKDMGNHYLEDESLELIQTATEAEINILVMHHSVEWFYSECKERLRDLIAQKYALVLFGHEHRPIGESRNTNENGAIQFIQGNALRGSTAEGNGFCLITVDCEDNSILAKSFIWKKDFYVSKEILSGEIKRIPIIEFPNDLKFIEYIERNHCQQALNSCFVMPSLSCTKYNKNREPSVCDIESEEELFDIILEYKKIFLSGKHKSGKTTLAKRIYKRYLESGSVPILLYQDNFFKGNFEKLIKHAFEEQYQADDNDYQKFEQLPQNRKIIIVDDADLIVKPILEKLIKFIEGKFGKILIIGENSAQFDIHQQVIDSLVEDRIKLTVKPFLYKKRKMLIKTILNNKSETCKDIENEAQKINELINSQVKIFDLAPEFIMSFVELYENDSKLQYFNGKNVFSLVYESNIVQKINQVVYNTTTEIIINILRELAFRMHFRKHFAITELEIISIVDCYNKTYRQKLSGVTFLDIVLKAKILTNNEGEYRFRDKTLMAYFVARALNNKYQKGEDIQVELDYLLRNLCFNINSDIVLFMALITNNIRFVETIVLKAEEFFDDMEELSFEKRNIKILSIAPIPVKNTLPTIEEKEKRDNNISIQEEKSLNDTLEMTYGYDYVEED
ncbi:MAG: metallophosphoesterase, partial [Eubacteriales bacterium]